MEWPRASDPVKHREWAATYEVQGYNVTVRYDGRWRNYEDYKPKPPWNKGRPTTRRMLVQDRCTAISDRVWPRTLYNEDGGCRAPHGAYAWSPGAPRGTPMATAIYEGVIAPDGTMTLTRDPNTRLFKSGSPIHLVNGWRTGPARFVGEEPFERLDGGAGRSVSILVELDAAATLPTTVTGLATLMTDRARHLAASGHRTIAAQQYAIAGGMLVRPANPGRGYRPDGIAMHAGRTARGLLNLYLEDPSWNATATAIDSEIRTVIAEIGYYEYEARANDRARAISSDSDLVRLLMPTDEGDREADRLKEEAAAMAATPDGRSEKR